MTNLGELPFSRYGDRYSKNLEIPNFGRGGGHPKGYFIEFFYKKFLKFGDFAII